VQTKAGIKARLTFGVAGLLAITLASAAAGEDAREIPDVKTIQELLEIQPQGLSCGWEVRLAFGEPGAEAGPWGLLYCYAKLLKDEGRPPTIGHKRLAPGEQLGPVFFAVEGPGGGGPLKRTGAGEPSIDNEDLFCSEILFAWPGTYTVRVRARDGRLLATRRFDVAKPRPCPWQPFACRREGPRKSKPIYAAGGPGFAAAPAYCGTRGLWGPNSHDVPRLERFPDGLPLPGTIPLREPWTRNPALKDWVMAHRRTPAFPLDLKIKDDQFTITAVANMRDWSDQQMLARWWVNGKAIEPARPEAIPAPQRRGSAGGSRLLRIGIGWPDSLGTVRGGDRLGLQLLYSPQVLHPILKDGEGPRLDPGTFGASAVLVPLLSNRLDFTVTPELMAVRQKNASGP